MLMKIKICGLTREEDILCVNNVIPDYIGFVFARSKRRLTYEQAMPLKRMLSPPIKAVGVFVNEDIPTIIRGERLGIIDVIQLHGDESNEYIHRLRARTKLPIIKAVRIGDTLPIGIDDIPADFLLLDKLSDRAYGGLGESFNWALLKNIESPFFLAGGINTSNIDVAMSHSPYCIDVSSGAETNGFKDCSKITALTNLIKKYNIKEKLK